MSTILDALRKVEEEKRTQEADVRTRLLANSSSRFDFRTRRRSRMPWVIGGGLVLVGTILGAGMMMWRTAGPPTEEVAVALATTPPSTPQVASVLPQQPVTPMQPLPNPTPTVTPAPPLPTPAPAQPQVANTLPAQVTDSARRTAEAVKPLLQGQNLPNAPAMTPPQAPRANIPTSPVPQPSTGENKDLGAAEAFPQYNPWHGGNPQATVVENNAGRRGGAPSRSEEVVQRSPFVNASPYDRIVAPPTPSPPSAPRVTATAKAPQRTPILEEKRSKSSPAPARRNDTAQNATPSRAASIQENTGSPPPGTSLSFLQWSADPEKRVASIKVGTGPATLAHEGDSIEGMTIEKIRPDAVELRSGDSRYLLRAR